MQQPQRLHGSYRPWSRKGAAKGFASKRSRLDSAAGTWDQFGTTRSALNGTTALILVLLVSRAVVRRLLQQPRSRAAS